MVFCGVRVPLCRRLAVLLCACMLLPGLLCKNLRCLFCPLQAADKTCKPMYSECLPQEVCHKATGRYGSYGVLASRGCVPEKQCSTGSRVFYMGVGYNLSYSCCSLDFCNSSPAAPAPLLLLVLLPAAAALLLPGGIC
nr:sperm acrosome membrane-associated protein 4-like [Paramormyrops kingsleyae]